MPDFPARDRYTQQYGLKRIATLFQDHPDLMEPCHEWYPESSDATLLETSILPVQASSTDNAIPLHQEEERIDNHLETAIERDVGSSQEITSLSIPPQPVDDDSECTLPTSTVDSPSIGPQSPSLDSYRPWRGASSEPPTFYIDLTGPEVVARSFSCPSNFPDDLYEKQQKEPDIGSWNDAVGSKKRASTPAALSSDDTSTLTPARQHKTPTDPSLARGTSLVLSAGPATPVATKKASTRDAVAPSPTQKPADMDDAFRYLVLLQDTEPPHVYHKFLDMMKDYKSGRWVVLNQAEVAYR